MLLKFKSSCTVYTTYIAKTVQIDNNIRIITSLENRKTNVEVTNPTYDTSADKKSVKEPIGCYAEVIIPTKVKMQPNPAYAIADKKPVKEPTGYFAEVIVPTEVKIQPNPAYAVP